jgi:hypothetical protein
VTLKKTEGGYRIGGFSEKIGMSGFRLPEAIQRRLSNREVINEDIRISLR